MRRASPFFVLLLWVTACSGDVVDGMPAGPARDGAGVPGAGGGSRTADEAGYDGDDMGGLADIPAPATRTARLTHRQWANTVSDLFGIDAGPFVEGFRVDPSQGGFLFRNNAAALSVDAALWSGYARAAADVAEQVFADADTRQAVVGDGSDADAWIAQWGLRLHRRPLDSDTAQAYRRVFDAGTSLYDDMDAFDAGARAVIEAMLQSPFFLYRVEQSETVQGDVIPLDDYEVATRLSYLLWDTAPDQALFDAAAAGQLTRADQVEAQARRMLEDPRAEAMVADFHAQLFESERFSGIDPSEAFFSVADDFGEMARTEHDLFVRDLFERGGGVSELLTSSETFVNAELAAIYGLDGSFGDEFVGVSLDDAQRRGILTQVGFLALNSSAVDPDPIHRGVFIARHISCINLAAPPDDVPPLPDPSGRTNRQRVADHTEVPGSNCAGCHSRTINPFGFVFENYDATGALRTEDLNMPVDTTASPLIDGQPQPVSGALELIDALSTSRGVHECFARHWVEFAYGRLHVAQDDPLIDRLAALTLDDRASLAELLVGLVKSEAFLTRNTQELP